MSARAWRRLTVGAFGGLIFCLAACKPEAPAKIAGSPEAVPDQEADPAQQVEAAPDAGSPPAADTAEDPSDSGAEPTNAEPEPEEPEAPAIPEEPYRVLMIGDSLIATGIGALLEKKLDAHPHVVAYRKGKSSSGLARCDFYDWIDQAKRQVEFRKPDLTIVILGGNDGQDLTRPSGGGRRVTWKSEDWPGAYRERVDAFLAELTGEDRSVLWIGLPYMGLGSLEKKLILIRGVQKEAVEALGDRGVYLDSLPFVTTEDGKMLQTAKVGPRNKTQSLRAEDKIHFTMAGSEYFADHVYPTVLEVLALPDVQPEP